MLDRLFKQSATEMAKERFGIKFVRIGLEEMHYLEWLYPDAKFMILFRNPWDCWRSYKGYWMFRWPKGRITTVQQFAKFGKDRHVNFFRTLNQIESTHLRYEDFLHPDFNWDRLKTFCELPKLNQQRFDKQNHSLDCQMITKICPNQSTDDDRGLRSPTQRFLSDWLSRT